MEAASRACSKCSAPVDWDTARCPRCGVENPLIDVDRLEEERAGHAVAMTWRVGLAAVVLGSILIGTWTDLDPIFVVPPVMIAVVFLGYRFLKSQRPQLR